MTLSRKIESPTRNIKCAICGKEAWTRGNYLYIEVCEQKKLVHKSCNLGATKTLLQNYQDEMEMLRDEVSNLQKLLEDKPKLYISVSDDKPKAFGNYLVKLRDGSVDICIFEPWSSLWVDRFGHTQSVASWMPIPT